jgi:GDP-4-dehydro-6-deoxy-D-mannose reductase
LAPIHGQSVVAADFDLLDHAAIRDAIRHIRPAACLHLAAIAAVQDARADPDLAWDVNLRGTLVLARALLESAPACLLLHASTADAYGASFKDGLPVSEASPLAPLSTYAATKAAADLALGAMVCEGLRVVRLRAFNHTGPGQSDAFVVASFARQLARIEAGLDPPVLRVGLLETRRDFLDVRDVCRAWALCLEHHERLPPGTVLNLASGTSHRIGDVLDSLLALSGIRASVEIDPARLRPTDIPVAVGDAAAARAVLGWAPRIPWHQTMTDTIADWRTRVRC